MRPHDKLSKIYQGQRPTFLPIISNFPFKDLQMSQLSKAKNLLSLSDFERFKWIDVVKFIREEKYFDAVSEYLNRCYALVTETAVNRS